MSQLQNQLSQHAPQIQPVLRSCRVWFLKISPVLGTLLSPLRQPGLHHHLGQEHWNCRLSCLQSCWPPAFSFCSAARGGYLKCKSDSHSQPKSLVQPALLQSLYWTSWSSTCCPSASSQCFFLCTVRSLSSSSCGLPAPWSALSPGLGPCFLCLEYGKMRRTGLFQNVVLH